MPYANDRARIQAIRNLNEAKRAYFAALRQLAPFVHKEGIREHAENMRKAIYNLIPRGWSMKP